MQHTVVLAPSNNWLLIYWRIIYSPTNPRRGNYRDQLPVVIIPTQLASLRLIVSSGGQSNSTPLRSSSILQGV